VTAVSSSEILHYGTAFLPDGDRFLYVAQSGEGVQAVYTATLERPGVPVRLIQSGSQAIYVPPWNGHAAFLLFRSGPALMAQPVDGALRVKGSPIRVADDVATVTGRFGPAFFSAGGATIAYRGGASVDRQMVRMSRTGQRLQDIGAPRAYGSLQLSPDGQYAAFSATDRGGNADVWVLEFRRGVETRLTTGPSADYSPAWSPDGRQIAFISERDGVTRVYRMSSGGGAEESLAEGWQVRDWSRDGGHLLFGRMGPATGNDFLALPLTASGAGKPVRIAQTRFNEPAARFSQDSRWVAYQSNESGSFQIYVQPFPEPPSGDRRRVQVSKDGGLRPRWRADGQELFFLSANNEVIAAPVRILPDKVEVESPIALFRYSVGPFFNYSYDVTANGQEFVVLEEARRRCAADGGDELAGEAEEVMQQVE
jgi:eukaryotic-like serine/threonine-protein kinase